MSENDEAVWFDLDVDDEEEILEEDLESVVTILGFDPIEELGGENE